MASKKHYDESHRTRAALRLRVYCGGDIALGPGKADLLELIAESGSISEAAREMDMSYKRAWSLVKTMNESFAGPLVHSEVGGKSGGGAQLTALGAKVLSAYRKAEAEAVLAARPHLETLRRHLRREKD